MKRPPPKPGHIPPEPGLRGFIRDQNTRIRKALKAYVQMSDNRRKKLTEITRMAANDIKYETRDKDPADKRARQAGMVEKLK
jgi:hypothetical protein